MAPDWVIRLLLAFGIMFTFWLVFNLVSRLALKRVNKKIKRLKDLRPATATIVYFTTPDCAACKAVQRPALLRLQESLGSHLQVVEINAYENEKMARDWGVLSVPTTFLLDAQGIPRQVNFGATSFQQLLDQVRQLSPENGLAIGNEEPN